MPTIVATSLARVVSFGAGFAVVVIGAAIIIARSFPLGRTVVVLAVCGGSAALDRASLSMGCTVRNIRLIISAVGWAYSRAYQIIQ